MPIFYVTSLNTCISDFIWDFGKLPFPTHLGKYFIKIGKIRAKIHERTSDSLNEGLPIKMTREKFQRK